MYFKSNKTMLVMALLFSFYCFESIAQKRPNILILIADDMGTDAMPAYNIGTDQPNTPNLDAMLEEGILFKNTWAYGTCAPSRASLITGRFGNKNGIMRSGPNLDNEEITIFEHISELTSDEYADAVFGKWHLGDASHPNDNGVDHYAGNLFSGVDDYFLWDRWINGVQDVSDEYATTYITDEAINWLDNQTEPWILWMAYNAPHGPIHLPPDSLYTREDTNSSFDQYMCMVESVDHEVGRLYSSLTQEEKDSTLVIFVGDNGTPNSKIQGFPQGHGKGTVYQGGINVPMFMMGYGVERINEEEEALISFTDIFATITEMLGTDLPGGTENSFSFYELLSDPNAATKTYNYSELVSGGTNRAIRNDQYKLIIKDDIEFEFYDLLADPFELTDLYPSGLSTELQAIFDELMDEADNIFYSWSCNDDILNGDENDIDCGGSNCETCIGGEVEIFAHYFESGWDGWTSGGDDCVLHTGGARAYEGVNSIRIRDNSGVASSITSEIFDLSNYETASLSFHFYANSMEANENFTLEINNGSGWVLLADYISGQDFENNTFTEVSIENIPISSTTSLRFTCDASNNQDRIFLDAIVLSGVAMESLESIDQRSSSNNEIMDLELKAYPNPALQEVRIESTQEIIDIKLFDINGQLVGKLDENELNTYDISFLNKGLYFISAKTPLGLVQTKLIKL